MSLILIAPKLQSTSANERKGADLVAPVVLMQYIVLVVYFY